jgi:hypothetical protein
MILSNIDIHAASMVHGQSTRNPQALSNAYSISGQRAGGNSVMTAPRRLR